MKKLLRKLLPAGLFTAARKLYHRIVLVFTGIRSLPFYICRIFPMRNKVIATCFKGSRYGDNTQYIVEQLHAISPDTDIVWLKDSKADYEVPSYVRTVPYDRIFRLAYEVTTAKVLCDTHRLPGYVKKRKGQLFIQSFHGGLGIKKLDGDVSRFDSDLIMQQQLANTARAMDLFTSNSDHLSRVERSALKYDGPIWKVGCPKNDILVNGDDKCSEIVRKHYGLSSDSRIILYLPTFRDSMFTRGFDEKVYDMDYEAVRKAFEDSWGGNWHMLVRFHPYLANDEKANKVGSERIINVTHYPDTQQLILASDVIISDYSSAMFDGAIAHKPCFVYANDFEDYKKDRGVYLELEDLPFPIAVNNAEMIKNVKEYSAELNQRKWEAFAVAMGLKETGHAARDIASLICDFLNGKEIDFEALNDYRLR